MPIAIRCSVASNCGIADPMASAISSIVIPSRSFPSCLVATLRCPPSANRRHPCRWTMPMISCLPDMNSILLVPTESSAAARFFRVLGDPTRLKILELLGGGERTVGELVSAVGQPQPRVSTHLACLRHCGFVSTERRGKEVVYRLALDGLGGIVDRASEAMTPIAGRLATCTRIGPDWV